MPSGGQEAIIEVFSEYEDGLLRIGENSHIWVISWFHKAPRNILRTRPLRVNPDLPEYGVFGLRAFARPNPIGLSLVKIQEIKGNRIYVEGLDAVGGTPIIDLKPYYENDIVFSPQTPYIKAKDREMRIRSLKKQAFVHHREKCSELGVAVRMAAIAEDHLGKLNCDKLFINVTGSHCLGDCIQGLSKARIANPPRLSFEYSDRCSKTVWTKGTRQLTVTLKETTGDKNIDILGDEEIFQVSLAEQK